MSVRHTIALREIPITLFSTAPGEVSNDCFSRMCSNASRKGVPYRSNTGRGSRSVLDGLGNNVVPPGSAEHRLCLQFHSHPDQLPNPSFSPKPPLPMNPTLEGPAGGDITHPTGTTLGLVQSDVLGGGHRQTKRTRRGWGRAHPCVTSQGDKLSVSTWQSGQARYDVQNTVWILDWLL